MADTVKLHDKQFKIMIPESEIDAAVQRVADKLNERYAGKTPIFLGVLSGAFLFLSDLVRKLSRSAQAGEHIYMHALLQAREVPLRILDRLCRHAYRQRIYRWLRSGLQPAGSQPQRYLRHR